MAPQFGPGSHGGPIGSTDCTDNAGQAIDCPPFSANDPNDAPLSGTHLNIPMLALGLALAAFLLVCFSICICTYRRAKARSPAFRAANLVPPEEIGRSQYVGLGLGLQDRNRSPAIVFPPQKEDGESKREDVPPPAYTPKQTPAASPRTAEPSSLALGAGTSNTPLLSLSPSPALMAPVSPALSNYSLSPALSQGDFEETRLLGGRRSITPPPPTYAR